MTIRYILTALICFSLTTLFCQCPDSKTVIYNSKNPYIKLDSLAAFAAPVLWFSPDEPNLFNEQGEISLPQALPYDAPSPKPIVYYKINKLYTPNEKVNFISSDNEKDRTHVLDLSKWTGIEIQYYFYYESEQGAGSHPHDLESVQIQIQVKSHMQCEDGFHSLDVKRIVAKAHGLYWFENTLNTDQYTLLPICILVEEGKHASCTDKNADGVYTPGFDVTEKVNDAWGIRDIISTGRLYSGGFQGWMAKARNAKSLLVPPNFENTRTYEKIKEQYPDHVFNQTYEIKAFPKPPELIEDKKLRKIVESKKPKIWPKQIKSVSPKKEFLKLSKDNKLRNKVGFSYRWDAESNFSLSIPLLIFRHVEAPMTGGWLYHKFFLGQEDSGPDVYKRLLGHQIQHTTSASRWLDTYVGLGYEIIDIDQELESINNDVFFVSEIGLKLRVNITHTPLKFLKILGTDYWGLSIGWKNIGFNPFLQSGFVLQIGAGAF